MSDPFFGLNINNLQTINATNNTRLQDMNHSMTKPLMSSHLPQLPQQQMRTSMALNSRIETADEESDERKKFEKYRKFQLQQKRLQEMSFSKIAPTDSNSAADKLMANIIQKVESEAKFDKRINNYKQGINVYNQPLVQNNVSLISGAIQSPNTTIPYVNQFSQNMSATGPSIYMSGQQLPQNSSYFNSFYPSNPTTKTSIQQMTNTGVETLNYGPTQASGSDGTLNYSFLPQMTTNSTINSMISTNANLISNSDPIFSITTSNSINTGVANSLTNPIPSIIRPPVVQKLPNCFEDVSKMPALYLKVWNYVKINDINNVCDTNRLYPVLLSVGLPQTTLAKLWSVVNLTIPGQLTRHELNMALALIALIQNNNPNPLDEIYRLDSLPMPTIKFFEETNERTTSFPEVLQISTEIPTKPHLEQTLNANNYEQNILNQNYTEFTQNVSKNDQNFWPNIEKTITGDKPTEDDFDDFKSADFSSILSTVSQTVGDLTTKQSSGSKIEVTLNNTTEEEFDDFKSVTFEELNPKNVSTEPTKLENQINSKTHKLSDALMSNISAISSHISNLSSDQSLNSIPVVTISSMDSLNSGENTLESSPKTNSSPELRTAFNPNTNSVDKYSVFRELSAETTKDDDFGNFLCHTNNCDDSQSVDSLQFGHQDNCDNSDSIESIGQQIIQISRQIIHKSFNVLVVNHGANSVLEAINGTDGNKFAFDLLEVYEIVKRVEKNLKINDKLNNYLIKLIEDIDNTWNSVRSVFTKASINVEIKTDSPENDQNSSQCCICCSKATPMRPLLTFAGYDYHTSCANLWLNCINPTLPQPLINSH